MTVWLAVTQLSGTIPDSLGLLTALTDLDLGEYVLHRYLAVDLKLPSVHMKLTLRLYGQIILS
eukprot:SAG31_NODE_27514_length_425_cov_0.567485_2_plen_62_part_01